MEIIVCMLTIEYFAFPEETATAFTVSSKALVVNPQIHKSKSKRTWLGAYIEAVTCR